MMKKRCFCIGPENCSDETCPLVKAYKERKNKYVICKKGSGYWMRQ
jgi:hypothetical protein